MTEDGGEKKLGKVDVATLANYRLVDKLAESERRYQELLDDLPDVVVRISANGSILYVNGAWHAKFGFNPKDSVGEEFISYLHPEDHDKFASLIDPENTSKGVGQSVRIPDVNGRIHLVDARLRRIDGEEVVGILEDVTVRQQLEAERNRAQRLESIGRLAGGLAHDFNNLLSVVLGNLELAMDRLGGDGESNKELEYASRACVQATEIARQMLSFSKGGEPSRRPERIDLIVREAFDLYLRGSRVIGDVEVEGPIGMVHVDASQMHQVLNNLIINAIDAMPAGGRLKGRIRSGTTGSGASAVVISIRDEGEGIPDEKIEKIFEPYFTTKESGNGLGLTSSYGIVIKHGGELEVESEVGVGTEFRIVLETVDEEPEHFDDEVRPVDQVGPARILVMDDDDMVRSVIVAMLESLGHLVVESRHGQECVDAFLAARDAKQPFDLVVLDLTIVGGHDGLWSIRNLMEIDPGVKALVATGYNNAPVVADPAAHGFIGAVSKPTTLDELKVVILEALSSPPPRRDR